MPKLNGKGPDESGEQKGRGIGRCQAKPKQEMAEILGHGMGLRRHSGGGPELGKRLRSGLGRSLFL